MDKAKKIGNNGEKQVASQLISLPSNNFKLFNNVLLKTKTGTTQIDHLLVTTRGIFVIETKAHKGKIYGDAQSKYWTQCLFGKNRVVNKYTFYSPYKQNQGHLRNVILSLKTNCVCGIICFTSKDVNISCVSCESVIPITLLYQVICNIFMNANPADYDFNTMCSTVRSLNIQNSYQDKKHIKYVKQFNKGGKK